MLETTKNKRTLPNSQFIIWDLLDAEEYGFLRVKRPRTRADCRNVPRPCPWVSCRYHLYLDVTQYGSIKLNRPDIEPWEMNESCALDVADRGKHSLVVTGRYFGISGERIRQVIDIVMERLTTNFNSDQKVA